MKLSRCLAVVFSLSRPIAIFLTTSEAADPPPSLPLGAAFKRFDVGSGGGGGGEGREAGVPKSAAILYGGGDGDAEIESGQEEGAARAGGRASAADGEIFAARSRLLCEGNERSFLSPATAARATCLFSRRLGLPPSLAPSPPPQEAAKRERYGKGRRAVETPRLNLRHS